MRYPALLINEKKFRSNARCLAKLMAKEGLQFHVVSKCFAAHEPMVQALVKEGIHAFADSRLANLARLRPYAKSLLLLRLPQLCEIDETVRLCELSLNSERRTLMALDAAALRQGKTHGVILMLELGDRREGMAKSELPEMIALVLASKGLHLAGIGANFNCYGGVIPSAEKMEELLAIKEEMEAQFEIAIPLLSAGNSGNIHLLFAQRMPAGINHLRLGEALLLGRETSYGKAIPGLAEDVFVLRAQIIEDQVKPSLPDGEQGPNMAGEFPVFEDQGQIRRVILALGGQDVRFSGLRPLQPGIAYLGNSSDHSIYQVLEAAPKLQVGDCLDFALDYLALTAAFTSSYIYKELI